MSRLTVQAHADWIPFPSGSCIAVLDCSTEQATEAFGWTWDEVDEEGLGPMFYVPLSWDGRSRFLLSASGFHPESGVAVEASASEAAAVARHELLAELGLTSKALLALSEGDEWFARWDPPHNAGQRPETATKRPFGPSAGR
jgi:hypothetical protein